MISDSKGLAPLGATLERVTASSPPASGFAATVVIVTKDRQDDALRAVRSAIDQEGPIEVLVICDGATDGTAETLEREFGGRISLYSAHVSRGYIVRRNEAAALARSPILVSLDDDAAFTDRTTVARVLPAFTNARVASVAMPYVNVLQGDAILQLGRSDVLLATDRYTGTAHALRRDDFMRLGGYREAFIHQGEESDFCLRLLGDHRLTVLGTSPPIHHFQSSVRDISRVMYLARQNEVLFAAWNVPWPYVVPHLLYTTLSGVVIGFRYRAPRQAIAGLVSGYRLAMGTRRMRQPVNVRIYRLARGLRKRGPKAASDVLARLIGTRSGVASHEEDL